MTNNPTIDGVSRELLERACANIFRTFGGVKVINEIREVLDAPTVERQEPVQMASMPVERCYDVRAKMIIAFNEAKKAGGDLDDALEAAYQSALRFSPAPQDFADLQSTIARLEAQIAELESGRGELVMKLEAERLWGGAGEYAVSFVKAGWLDQCRKTGGEFLLYTAPPAPVAVILPDKVEERPQGNKTLASVYNFYRGWNACRDAAAALNGVKL